MLIITGRLLLTCGSILSRKKHLKKTHAGQGNCRTIDTERADTLFLRRMFGDAITMKEEVFGGGRTTTRNYNPYGRTMRIPF